MKCFAAKTNFWGSVCISFFVAGTATAAPVEKVESAMAAWTGPIGALGAALIAGVFAVYQFQKRNLIERQAKEIERERAAKDTEIGELRLAARAQQQRGLEFRIKNLEPVMDAINHAVIKSYPMLLAPQAYEAIAGHVPLLRRAEGRAEGDWAEAMEKLSDLRMRLLLSINRDSISPVMGLLMEQTLLGREMIDARRRYYSGNGLANGIHESHRKYVEKSFELMLAIRDALTLAPNDNEALGEEMRRKIAEDIAEPLERASMVSVPFGISRTCGWVCMWRNSQQIIKYGMNEHKKTFDDLQKTIADLTTEIHSNLGRKLDVKLVMTQGQESSGSIYTYLLSVTFSDQSHLDEFVSGELPAIKTQAKEIWTGFLTPTEFIIDMPKRPALDS